MNFVVTLLLHSQLGDVCLLLHSQPGDVCLLLYSELGDVCLLLYSELGDVCLSLYSQLGDVCLLQEEKAGVQGLYILNAQFEHEGWYECRATTVYDSISAGAYLTVWGQLSWWTLFTHVKLTGDM